MGRRSWNKLPSFIALLRKKFSNNLEAETEDVHDKMVRNWEKGMDARGRSWEPLAEETIRKKGHADPLIETGTMIDSTGYEVNDDNLTARIYVEDPKIAFHEFGTETIPARPVLQPAATVLSRRMEEVVGESVDEAYVNARASGAVEAIVRGQV